MNKLPAVICLSLFLIGQKAQVVNSEVDGDAGEYSITQPEFVYRGEYLQFQTLDYKNFVLHTFDEKKRHEICGKLHDGRWEDREKNHTAVESLKWENVFPLSSDNPSVQYVLAYFTYFGVGGSSESDGYAQVWRLQDKKLTIVQQIQFNTHFAGDKEDFAFDRNRQLLSVRASHYLPGDAHCCISAFDELTFRWEYGLFKLQKKVTKPTGHASSR